MQRGGRRDDLDRGAEGLVGERFARSFDLLGDEFEQQHATGAHDPVELADVVSGVPDFHVLQNMDGVDQVELVVVEQAQIGLLIGVVAHPFAEPVQPPGLLDHRR